MLDAEWPPKQQAADDNHQQSVEHREKAGPTEEQQTFEVAAQIEDERVEKLAERKQRQQAELVAAVAQQQTDAERRHKIAARWKWFWLRNVFCRPVRRRCVSPSMVNWVKV